MWQQDAELILATTIIYDTLDSGKNAIRVLSRVGGLEAEAEGYPHLWETGLLEDPEWFAAAVGDALRADIILVALRNVGALTPQLREFIELCMQKKEGEDCALIALIGPLRRAGLKTGPELKFLSRVIENARFSHFHTGAENGSE